MASLSDRLERTRRTLQAHGQEHLLPFPPLLDDAEREQLLSDIGQIDFDRCAPLIQSHVRQRPHVGLPQRLEPAPAFGPDPSPGQEELYKRARQRGAEAIHAGRVAAFTVAGGQGTRLGFDGPKGAFPITPIRDATLFQVFAESLRGTERRYGCRPRWYLMTSQANHDETVAFFEEHRYFGLNPGDVRFFQQALMPAFLPDGRMALEERHRVAPRPNGHGGSLQALADSGALAEMRARGIDTISYFQVDNPLVRTLDPLFVGLHLENGAEMSSKAVHKAYDQEKVGVFCLADGRLEVIEYSDMPEALATARNPDGSRRFDAGSIAIHVLSREFVERLTQRGATVQLPWHRADKKVTIVDDHGQRVEPKSPNAIKLEMFVFDAIPLARNPLVLFTPRSEEFSPVKNAEGVDSPATTKRDLVRRAACWLEACGVNVPRGADGEPAAPLEISPRYALDAEDLKEHLPANTRVEPGRALLLA